MDDRRAHFLTMLGDAASAAGVAAFPIALIFRDGSNLTGAPSADDLRDIDCTGYAEALLLDGTSVDLADVAGFAIFAP